MKHFYLIANPSKPGALGMAEKLEAEFLRRGAACMHTRGYTRPDQIPTDTECIITLGGDGTLIQASRDLISLELPMMGINMGHLGYLTQVSGEEFMDPVLDALLNDSFTLEKRMMLTCGIAKGDERTEGIIALNDICITRDLYKILEFHVFVNDEFVDTLLADGVIICTPTGSTAYNLSAGGPVLKADAQIIAITPISPHTLTSRPIVVSADDVVTVEVKPSREDTPFTVSADGQNNFTLTGQNVVQIRRADVCTTIIKTKPQSFYDVLRHKLK